MQLKLNLTKLKRPNQFNINFFTPYLESIQIHNITSKTIEFEFVRLKLNKV